jgi:ubiquinone/menaquinone biosynthesis C-methylase UbiE
MSASKTIARRVQAEQEAHEQTDVNKNSRKLKGRFNHIKTYPSKKRLNAYKRGYFKDMAGKQVLDYGCGWGKASLNYLKHGATVHGIDIAANHVAGAEKTAAKAGFTSDKCMFEVMDAHALSYADNSFDMVIGNSILHHLDADTALAEVYRVLKPGGRALFSEPLADNPLLRLFRKMTPNARTVDERPFSGRAVQRLADPKCWAIESIYCGLIEAPIAMVTSIVLPGRPDNWLLSIADTLEQRMNQRQWLWHWNQYVLLNLVKRPVEG